MVRSIEIPEPLLECDVETRWERDDDIDVFTCKVLVDGRFSVYEKVFRHPGMNMTEDDVRNEFLAEFATRFKELLSDDRT